MNLIEVNTKREIKIFRSVTRDVYKGNFFYRGTEDDITKLIIQGPTVFHSHASVCSFLIQESKDIIGRFSLIVDQKLPNYVQVSFFEALPGFPEIVRIIREKANEKFPLCKRIVFGVNGHLNYGAGFLMNRFNEAPVFGLPYTQEYYKEYFRDLEERTMVSYRFSTRPFFRYYDELGGIPSFGGITVRKMNRRKLRREAEIYTYLNNACFPGHPYWADRDPQEDYELFYPFRFLIKEENLLFAEKNGEPIGFFLWYPDFNQLVNDGRPLGMGHVLKYHLMGSVDTFRFTEIAVLPEYKVSHAVQAMILYSTPFIRNAGIKFGEGGFIFEENRNSIMMTRRFLERVTEEKMEPYHHFAVFEGQL